MSKIRTCICCGNTYSYCPSCDNGPSWKMLYDTEQCKEIFNIVSGYNTRLISKDQAVNMLDKINVGNITQYKNEISTTLQEIQATSVAKQINELSQTSEEKPKRRRRKR